MTMFFLKMVNILINKGMKIMSAMNNIPHSEEHSNKNYNNFNVNNSLTNMSSISSIIPVTPIPGEFLDEDLISEFHRRNAEHSLNNISTSINYVDKSINIGNVTTTSMNSIINLKPHTPMNLDFNKFGENPDETVHLISVSNDLPMLQEINNHHSSLKNSISKRFNSLKMVLKWWSESNIQFALNAINLMKDLSIINDFFNYAFKREDITKLPFSLDHAAQMIPTVTSLINSKHENFMITGCKSALILLRIFNEKISLIKSNPNDNNITKCENIVNFFEKMFNSSNLQKYGKREAKNELCKLANSLYTDLEFFLKPYTNKKTNN